MTVSDLILVAGLKRTVGIAYLQKLLGPAMNSAGALQKKAERLRNAHAELRNKLRKAEPQACVAEVDAWLAGADKSPANTPRDKKNCSCEARGDVVRNKPLIPGDMYIAVSNFYREKMIEFGFPAEKISYLPNYIDVTEYEVSKSHDDYILYFGRLSEEKGLETFIKAATLNPSINHFIVGAGPIELKLKTLVNEGNISNVTFLGFKSGAELKMIISRALCIVVPSEWYENCPMSVLESFASARPVIGSNIGGIPELISESIDGLIFKTHDAQDFALKIKWMSENKDEAIKMGLAGRKKVEDKFNKNLHYAGLMSIYKSVLGEAK